jgi:hypothetical protein
LIEALKAINAREEKRLAAVPTQPASQGTSTTAPQATVRGHALLAAAASQQTAQGARTRPEGLEEAGAGTRAPAAVTEDRSFYDTSVPRAAYHPDEDLGMCERCGKPATTETLEDETLCSECGADRDEEILSHDPDEGERADAQEARLMERMAQGGEVVE